MKRYNNWEEVFASAKPMKFHAFNTGRITGKVKTYADTTSFPDNVDINIVLDCDMLAFSFKHPEKGDILIDCGFSRSFTDKPPHGNLSVVMKIFQKLNNVRYSQQWQHNRVLGGIEPLTTKTNNCGCEQLTQPSYHG